MLGRARQVLKTVSKALPNAKKKHKNIDKFNFIRLRESPGCVARDIVKAVKTYGVETPIREQFLNVLVFLFGSLIAIGGFGSLHNYSQSQAQREFQRPAKEVASVLIDSIDKHVKVVEEARALFAGKRDGPNRWAFFEFSRKILIDQPGVQAIEWIPRVSQKRRAKLEKLAANDGLFKFKFFDRGPQDARVIAARRPEHFPIYYVEPYPGNEEVLGYDLSGDIDALPLMNRARDTGKMVALPLSDAAKRLKKNPGFVLVLPVYRTDMLPFTVKERRQELSGYVRVVVRLDLIMRVMRSNLSAPPGFIISFFGQEKGGKTQFLYHDTMAPGTAIPAAPLEAAKPRGVHYAALYDLSDWRLNLVFRPVPNMFTRNISSAAMMFVIFTLLLTALLLLYLVTSQAKSRGIEKSVVERTATLQSEIAQRKKIEFDLREAKEQAEMANRAKSEFLAMMSHELRTPLNAVIGFAEMMSNEVFGALGHPRYGQYSVHIRDSAGHLLSLINDILDLSKIEAEQYELHKEPIGLAGLWGGVYAMLRERIDTGNLVVDGNLEASPLTVYADDRAFRQILLNLLSNAIKFTPEGGRISVNADIDAEGRLVIRVIDTGIGIAADDLESVLEPFKQLESSFARTYEGTGLGLPLTQRLVDLHNGTLHIDSEPDRGTTVTLVFSKDIFDEAAAHDLAAKLVARDGQLVEQARATS